jgi:hypothetical protein
MICSSSFAAGSDSSDGCVSITEWIEGTFSPGVRTLTLALDTAGVDRRADDGAGEI